MYSVFARTTSGTFGKCSAHESFSEMMWSIGRWTGMQRMNPSPALVIALPRRFASSGAPVHHALSFCSTSSVIE